MRWLDEEVMSNDTFCKCEAPDIEPVVDEDLTYSWYCAWCGKHIMEE